MMVASLMDEGSTPDHVGRDLDLALSLGLMTPISGSTWPPRDTLGTMRFTFDAFTLHTNVFELRHLGVVRPLQPKPLDLLRYLIENRDRVVLKRELLSHLWADVRVTENALAQAVACVREALADTKTPAILGMRGRGYRFVLPVTEAAEERRPAERGKSGFVAPPGMALDLDVALHAGTTRGVRTVRTHARASVPLGSFRALLSAHAEAFPEDTVGGLRLGHALAAAETELALAELTTAFMAEEARAATVMILEGLEHADVSSLLLFCHLLEQPRGSVTLVGTSDPGLLRPEGVVARLLSPHRSEAEDRRELRWSETAPTSSTGVRRDAAAPSERVTSALAR
jgi:DNA-binding winged helix-turn-helix (wHTH) protein